MEHLQEDPLELTEASLQSICIPRGQRIEETYEPEVEEPQENNLDDVDFLG